jgi:hypothetical protein
MPPVGWRHERKFLLEGVTLAEAESLIKRHPAGFVTAFPERAINTLYLDTPELGFYQLHTQGVSPRQKVRLRWYGASQGGAIQASLEFKLKQGQVNGKLTYPLPGFGFDGAPVAGWRLGAGLPEAVAAQCRGLEAVLMTRYRRRYYRAAGGSFRLTLDYGLDFTSISRELALPPTKPLAFPHLILELKYAVNDQLQADRITQGFPFRLARFSKYATGLRLARPEV